MLAQRWRTIGRGDLAQPRTGGAGGQLGSERAYLIFYRTIGECPYRSARGSASRLTLGAALIVMMVLSLGFWWAVWEAVSSLVSAVLY